MNTQKIKRPGAGKTKGANSFVIMTLAELQNKLGANDSIRVSRIDMAKLGVKMTPVTQPVASVSSQPQITHETVQVAGTDFDA